MSSPAQDLVESIQELLGIIEQHHEVYDPTAEDIRAIRRAKIRLAEFKDHKIDLRSLPRE